MSVVQRLKFGLRVKLTLALVFVSALAVISAGYFTIQHSYLALKWQKQQDELVIAKNIAVQVDEVLNKAEQTVEILARHPNIISMDTARQRAALTIVTKVTELIDGLLILDLKGQITVFDQAEPDTRRLVPELPYKQLVQPVAANRNVQFSGIYKSKTGEIAVAISAPIVRDNSIAGVLSGGILLKNHSMGGIEEIRIGKSGYAYIVDSNGNIIVHPQRERLLENLSSNPPVQELMKKRQGILEFANQEGISVLAAFAPIKKTGWGVVVRQPTSESYAYAQRIMYFLIIVFVFILILAVGMGVYLAGRLATPLTKLVEGVRKVTEGHLETRITSYARDEIGQLAFAFNEMTLKLKQHLGEIEKAHEHVLQTQKQLAQSEKLAAIGQLVAGVAHEINNPLNVISGFNEVLLEKTSKEDTRRPYLDEIYRETGRCQQLITELLNFAKPKEPKRIPTDIGRFIQETLYLIQNQAKNQGIDLKLSLEEELPALELDQDQIKQVVLNLLLNACQAMPNGGELNICARQIDSHMEISIKDNGIGIPTANIPNIFNPFFTTKEEGTGLGLALSYVAVESHGGKIDVQSEEGKGSVFTVSLPLGLGKPLGLSDKHNGKTF